MINFILEPAWRALNEDLALNLITYEEYTARAGKLERVRAYALHHLMAPAS